MIIVDDIEQRSQEWKDLKAGVVSASNFHKIISAVKGDYSKQADEYAIKLISEKLTGEIEETYSSGHMKNGTIMEVTGRYNTRF